MAGNGSEGGKGKAPKRKNGKSGEGGKKGVKKAKTQSYSTWTPYRKNHFLERSVGSRALSCAYLLNARPPPVCVLLSASTLRCRTRVWACVLPSSVSEPSMRCVLGT